MMENQSAIMRNGGAKLLIRALDNPSVLVRREAGRCLGNLAANANYASEILKRGAIEKLVPLLRSDDVGCERMASMAIANIATNVRNQGRLIRMGVLEPLESLAKIGLDPKAKRDGETERYCLLAIANMAVSSENHKEVINRSLDTIIGFSKSSDVRCRQFSMFALGNLASDPQNLDIVMQGGCLKPIVSFAFPGDFNVQFQAVAALRGLAVNPEVRLEITRAGALEPLILAAQADNIEVQREVAAALANISLNEENKVQIARSGCLPAPSSLHSPTIVSGSAIL